MMMLMQFILSFCVKKTCFVAGACSVVGNLSLIVNAVGILLVLKIFLNFFSVGLSLIHLKMLGMRMMPSITSMASGTVELNWKLRWLGVIARVSDKTFHFLLTYYCIKLLQFLLEMLFPF